MQTNTMTDTPAQNTPPLEISPDLETKSQAPLSTYWMPLHELTHHWAEMSQMLTPAPVAPVLTAIGHAFLALAKETRALRLYTLAWQYRWDAPAAETTSRFTQSGRQLQEAAHHWSRAAAALDSLLPKDLDTVALDASRRLSRVARTQHERLWRLAAEVSTDTRDWRRKQERTHEQEVQ